ncbi:unnamed protein product [Polarella glacialis]|uniref:Methyltransferase type 11 domain-containing protein n=1 Tax=Polarella glacialis TaxID=89957 RepID=A0A813KR93_POLGL|nr:unnamed protein product [Polarella glacialis]
MPPGRRHNSVRFALFCVAACSALGAFGGQRRVFFLPTAGSPVVAPKRGGISCRSCGPVGTAEDEHASDAKSSGGRREALRLPLILAQLAMTPDIKVQEFYPLDKSMDAGFANFMATGMESYEQAVAPMKRELFKRLLGSIPPQGATVVEVGMGCLLWREGQAPTGMDIIGVDPNDGMKGFAKDNAKKAGLMEPSKKNSLRVVHGVAEALPLETASADAVVCTLTLCSVYNPKQAVAEIKRVLKPGGVFLFHEHVLSETNPAFAKEQRRHGTTITTTIIITVTII